jgi:hypothetical protein
MRRCVKELPSLSPSRPRHSCARRLAQTSAYPDALAIQFTRYDDLTDEERDTVEQPGRKGHVIIRERLRNVAGADELSPKQVVAAVQARVPYRFTTDDFQRTWKTLGSVQRPGRRIQSAPTKGIAPTTRGTGTTAIARRTSRSSYGSAPRQPASRD